MAREEVNFTKQALDQLVAQEGEKRRYVYDSKESGLLVQLTGNGRKTFQLYKKHMGKPVRVTIGTYPELTVEQARKKAREIKVDLANGENPNDKLKQQRQEMTFAGLFEIYLERHARVKKRSWQADREAFNRHLVTLGRKKLSTITRQDIAAIHSGIGKDRLTTAYSGGIRPPIPFESGHRFRFKPAGYSGGKRPLIPEEFGHPVEGVAARDNDWYLHSFFRGGQDAGGEVIHAQDLRNTAVKVWPRAEQSRGGPECVGKPEHGGGLPAACPGCGSFLAVT